MKKIYLFFIMTVLLFYPQAIYAQETKEQDVVRVCVLKDVDSVKVTSDSYKIYSRCSGQVLKEGKSLYKIMVSASPTGLLLGNLPIASDGIKIKPDKDGRIYIDRWRFRGDVDIFKTPEMKLVVVNHLGIEDYLYGVLYHEVSHWWPQEVLKAQAIVARTYALYQKRLMQSKEYDMTADVYSQVYGGRASEKFSTNRAVNATKGKVLVYNGDIFPTYYHATCGGFTEDACNLWNIDLPPLKGVECGFCKKSKHYKWQKRINLSYVEEALKKSGNKTYGITSIKIEDRNKSNRINNLIITADGVEIKIPGKDFRMALGPNLLRSNNYDVTVEGGVAIFNGIGWGHGVGMCQWGAYFMARKGYKAEDILKYYYPGAEVKQQ